VLVGGVGAIGGWSRWRRLKAPDPPEIPLTDVDPQAADVIQQARAQVVKNPKSADAWGTLGKVLRGYDYREQAAVCFARAEVLEPSSVRWPYLQGEALIQSDREAAIPHLRRAAGVYEQSPAVDNVAPWLRLGEVLLAVGRYDEAEISLRRALDMEPDDASIEASIHLNLGLLALVRDDLKESRAQLLRCLDNPCSAQKASAHLAIVAERRGEPLEAAARSRSAASLPADAAWPDPFLMECQRLAKGRSAQFRYVASLEAKGTPDKLREAVDLLQEMLQERPEYRVYVALGTDLGKLGDLEHAEAAFRAAIDLGPDNARACLQLCRLLFAQAERLKQTNGDAAKVEAQFRESGKYAEKVLACKQNDALAHVYLGMSRQYLGEHDQALVSLRRAVQCGPELVEPHLRLGEVLAEDGQFPEARRQLEIAAELAAPTDTRPRDALKHLDKLEHTNYR
jgi:tetratricopeptide (TPR) repeat protein